MKVMIALLSVIVVGLMLVPSGASAGTMVSVVQDSTGDLGFGFDPQTSEMMPVWGPGTPWVKAGYFDIASAWLSQKGSTFSFGMELAAALPKEGSALPGGIQLAEWALWIDPSPFNVVTNPVAPLFLIALRYDGSTYSAFILDFGTMVMKSVPFSVGGAQVQLRFSAASVGNLAFEWWVPFVRIWQGPLGSAGFAFVDGIDWGSAPGQVYYDIPWPSQ